MSFVLEPRMLFDASIVATSTQPKNSDSASTNATSSADHAAASASSHDVPAADATVKPADSPDVKDPQHAAQKNDANTPAANDTSAQTDRTPQSSGAPADSVLFVDPRVSGWKALADSVSSNTKVVVLDPTLDGITQVTKALDGMHGIKEVDFLTYGQAGQIELGASTVNDATLHARAQDIAGWRDSLADNAQIQFWGCDVGAGTAGAAFVNDLHALTGVGVAASTDATGLSTLGGDWALERTAGTVDPNMPFSVAAATAYDSVLDAPTAVVTLSGTTTDVLLGSSFTQTLTFDNTAANGVGYGPFVQLFVPTAEGTAAVADYRATLTSAKYLGVDVSVQTIVLSDQIAGHVGTVGAINPLLLDASGQPTFVAAPAGFQVGDTMYVLTLPFGSFTANQPKAEVTLTFALDNRSELTNSGGLQMVAIGGYQYGADALNNPNTDAPVLGASATSSLNVKLLNVKTEVSTEPGEGETATGSSHPGHYVITLEPAPVASGQPINNLVFTMDLPSDVQWTGGTIAISGGGVAEVTPSASGPGGTLTVRFASLSAQQTIDIPIFVPQTAVGGGQVIDPGTGNPEPVNLNPTYAYTANNWTPAAGSFDSGSKVVSGSGNGTDPTFTAKSLAIQVDSDIFTDTAATGFSPGDIVKYTIKFQVSDYFDLSQLKLADILGDGMTLLPGMSPVLDVVRNGVSIGSINFGAIADGMTTDNGQTVATSGTASFWNYVARDASGQTAINFDVGGLLGAQPGGDAVLQGTAGGTEGTVTFYAKVLDRYTDTNGGASLRESDVTTNTVTGSGKVTSHVPGSTAVDESDTSGVTDEVARGNLTMEITNVGGTPINPGDPVNVQAGQLVTYTVTYDLTQGDYGNLDVKAFLPLPVYNLTTMTAGNGTDVNTFTVLSNPSGGTPTATVDTVGNAISFNFGTHDNTGNAGGQKVTVQFTVRASDQPFADGLALTSQAQASYTSAGGTNVSDTAIRQQTMLEPSLTTKTGVVSLVSNAGTAEGGAAYAGDTGSGSANPTTVFQPSGNSNVFTGTIPSTIAGNDVLNQNVSGADGRDSVRVVQTVENVGHGVAYDVIVRGTLPSGYSATDVTNLKVTRGDGTVLAFTGTTAQFFSGTGIQIHGGDGTQNSVVLEATGNAQNNDILYVTYDLKLTDTQAVGTTLALAGSILNWSSANNSTGFVSGSTPVGGTAASITDGATVATNNASFTKVISSTDNPNTTGNNVVVGETITYTFTITLPEGQMDNVTFTDVLPQYLTDVVMGSVTLGTNVTADGTLTLNYNAGTRTVTANFGDIKNANVDANGTVTFTVTAKVANDGTVGNNSTLPNTGTLNWDNHTLNGSVSATERDPSVTESITVNDADAKVHSGQTLTYTFTVTNNGDAPSEGFFDTIVLPSGLTWVNSSLANTAFTGAFGVTVDDTNHTVSIQRLLAGGSATFTFQATVNNDLAANTSLQVKTSNAAGTYTSMPGTVTGERSYTAFAENTVTTGVFVPTLVIVDQSNGTDTTSPPTQSNPQATADVVVGELVRMKVYVEVPTGLNNNVNFTVNLPTGLEYVGNATIALASGDGQMSSSVVDAAGNNGAIQVNSGGAFNVQTYNPTAALTAAAITGGSGSGGDVTFNLGQVQNNSASGAKNYVIVEFNAVVRNESSTAATNTALASFASMTGVPNSANATVTVREPAVTINKEVISIDQATGQVTWRVTLTNNGNAIAYNVNLNDTLAGNQSAISGLSQSGSAADLVVSSGAGTNALLASMTLGIGGSETFTYTTTVTDRTQSVANATATLVYASLDDTNSFITAGNFYGVTYTGDGIATSGSATGERNGSGGTNDYSASASIGLGLVTGNVWNDLGSALNTQDLGPNSVVDTRLQGVTMTGSWATGTSTTVTNGTGVYSFLLPTNVTVNVSAPATTTSSSTGSAAETLIYATDGTAGALIRHNESGLTGTNAQLAITVSSVTAITDVNFGYRLTNTAPIISTWGDNTTAGAKQYTVGGSAIVLSTGGTGITDTQIDTLVSNGLGDYSGTVLTLARNGGANSGDVFSGAGDISTGLFINGGIVRFNGVSVGSYTMTGGTLAVTFLAGTNATTVQNVLNNVTYSFAGTATTLDSSILINATLRDNNTQAGTTDGNRFQGTGGQATSAVAQVRIEIAPTSENRNFQEPNNTPASGNAVFLAPNLTLVNDQFTQVVLTISGGYQSAEDVLSYVRIPATMGNINGVWDPVTGTMTLTSAGGSATTAQWQTALRAVLYHDTSNTPVTGTRTVTFNATANDTSVISGTLATVTVARANDSPVLADVNLTIPNQTEDNLSVPPNGMAAGFLASSLVGNGTGPSNVTDPDGPSTVPSTPGLVITTADTTQGNWWYSTDGGNTWTEFASSSMTAISNANALHLVADGNTRLYFQPKTADWNGTIPTALTIRAWDQFSPTTPIASGTLGNIGSSGFGTGTNTAGSAYSSATDTVSLTVDPVNDAPVVSGTATVPPSNEDTPSATGTTVGTLLGQGTVNYTDGIDTVPGGSTGTSSVGIAITGNAATATQGTWQYFNGTSWVDIPTSGLSNSNALVLSSSTALRFVGAANWNGTPGALTAHISDGTGGLPPTGMADIASGVGGTGQWSVGTIEIGTTTPPVNDAPVVSGTATVPPSNEDTPSATGTTVGTLLGQGTVNYTDGIDTVPGGSTGTSSVGIAITGNLSTPAQGTWQYFNGTSWVDIPTSGLSNSNALVLSSSTALRFVGAANWNGTPGALTAHVSDGDTGLPPTGLQNIGTPGGTSQWSVGTIEIGTTTPPVNDAPVVSGTATVPPSNEDDPSATGTSVGTLLGQGTVNYGDGTDTVSGGSTGTSSAGIAITGNLSTAAQGTWQYSTDGGTSWVNIPHTGLSDTNAIVLPNTATLRFAPNGDWNGTPGALTARISDGDTGLPATGPQNLGTVGGTSQWSDGTITIGTVTPPVNDAPVVSGTATVPPSNEDDPSATGTTVGTLLGQGTVNYTDGIDTVPGGSTGTSSVGIAITGNAATAAQGTWQYFNGTSWVDIPTSGLSNSNALVLSSSTALRFVGAANWNGTPGALTAHISDGDTGLPPTGLQNIGTPGGTSQWSVGTIEIGTTTPPVNDAPVASGSVTLTTPGDTVTSLFTPTFNDTLDTVTGGSNANSLAGIAIVGNAANPSTQGTWQYSLDGGLTYQDVPTSVSNGSAVLLPDTAQIRFVGVPGYTGTPGGLTVRLIDSSSGPVTYSASTDVSTNGGITPISADTVPVGTIVSGSVAGSFQEPNNGPATGAAVSVNDTVILDLNPAITYTGATFQITGSYQNGQDVLRFTGSAGTGDIAGNWDAATGTMTLSSAGGATPAQWQAALRAIQYYNSSDTPATTDRTVTMTINQSGIGAMALGTSTITVVRADDSPVLADVNLTIPNQTEDNLGMPTGAVGFLASTLVGNGTGPSNVTDPDGPSTVSSTPGLAITTADTSQGNWWYSTDNGATWTEFASSSLTAVSNANALHLVADGNTRLYFQPKTTDWNGTIPTALTIRAWDQFSPTTPIANGTLADIGSSGFGTGINQAASAYSAATDTVSLTVNAVNDAPVASGTVILPSVPEDTTPATAPGQTVSSLFTPTFNDTRDTVSGGSSANSLAGIAITANAATVAQGNWQYTLDGTTWVEVPRTGLDNTTALILPSTASLRFVPEPQWNGTPGGLTVRLIDGSNTSNNPVAFSTSSDVSVNGNTTAISAALVPLTTTVVAVNDAPVVSGTATVPPSNEDAPINTGMSVSDLLQQSTVNYNDVGIDTVPGGSTGTSSVGIAITGNLSTAAQGTWQYSTDGGTTWVNIPHTGLSDTNAIVLPNTATLRFAPNGDWNGTPGALTARISDGDTGLPATGTQNLGTVGGTSQWSVGTIEIGTVTPPVNDAPVVSGTATVPPSNEDTPSATGTTVGTLLGQGTVNYTDGIDTVPGGSTGTSSVGIAITGNAATATQGTWQYFNGTSWVDIPTSGLSNSNALVLSSSTALRFVGAANWNGTPGALTAHVSDGDTGLPPTGLQNIGTPGGTSQWSVGTIEIGTTTPPVNDAPVVSGTATVPPSNEDAPINTGMSVSDLLQQGTVNYGDGTDTVLSGSTGTPSAGIAITGNLSTLTQGTWQYSTDGGTTWVDIPHTGLSDTNAIVLPNTATLRFAPNGDWNGTPGALTARISDGDTGLPAAGPQNLGTVGGTSQWSDGTIIIGTTTPPVNDAPVASGTVTFPPVNEDATPPGKTVTELFLPTFNDTRDTVTGGSNANSLAGIAITANEATATQGNWQYTLDGTTWVEVPRTGLDNTTALILPSTASLRFVPEPQWNGTPGGLTVRLIDGSNTSNNPVAFSTSSDVSVNGNATAISAATVPLTTTVVAINDAPVVSGTATVPPSNEDSSSPTGTPVSTLLGQGTINYGDGTDTVPGGSTGTPSAGIAITGNASTPAQGSWQYSTDGGTTWVDIPQTGLSETNALVLPNTATLRFEPAPNWNGTPGSLTAHISDGNGGLPTTGVQNLGGVGGTSQWSQDTISIGTTTPPVNDAPVVSGTATVPPSNEDTPSPTGTSVGTLLGQGTINYDDGTDTVPGGSTGTPSAGIAITGNASTPAQGTWQYSTDGGTTWVDIPRTGLSDTNALVLPNTATLRFEPNGDWNGTPGSLTARISDGNGGLPPTGAGDISTGVGGTGQWSTGTITIGTTTPPVNDAPVATGETKLPDIRQGTGNPPGATVTDLFKDNFDDSRDTVPGGSTAHELAGIAITGNTSNPTQGTWRYSLDGGSTWTGIPTDLGDGKAIILPSTAMLHFVPNNGFSGTPGGLTVRLIDSSAGPVTFSANTDVTINGGTTPYSGTMVPLSTNITPVPPVTGPNAVLPNVVLPSDYLSNDTYAMFGFYRRDLGGMPSDWLVGSNVYRTMLANQPGTAAVSTDVFYGTAPRQMLRYEAASISGGPIPPWLYFDPTMLTFAGTPPEGSEGSYDLRVVATDRQGRQATADVHIVVLREPKDVLGLLRPAAVVEDVMRTPASTPPAPPEAAPPAETPPTGDPQSQPSAPPTGDGTTPASPSAPSGDGAQLLLPPTADPANGQAGGQAVQGFGLSPQLREQTQAGRLARARALLDALAA